MVFVFSTERSPATKIFSDFVKISQILYIYIYILNNAMSIPKTMAGAWFY